MPSVDAIEGPERPGPAVLHRSPSASLEAVAIGYEGERLILESGIPPFRLQRRRDYRYC